MTRLTTNTTTPTGTGRRLPIKADEGQLAFGSSYLFNATAPDTAGRFDFMVATCASMTGPPLHVHEVQDDSFYVLEGLLTVEAGGEVPLGPEQLDGIRAVSKEHGTVVVGPPLRVTLGLERSSSRTSGC